MVGNENTVVNLDCGFCKKPAVNKRVICMNCKTTFHTSCASKKVKKCCEKQNFFEEESEVTAKQDVSSVSSKSNLYKIENENLRQINEELKENIAILTMKIGKLEAENSILKEVSNKHSNTNTQDSEEELINKIVNRVKVTFVSSFKLLSDEIHDLKTKLNKDNENKVPKKTNQDPKNVNIQKTRTSTIQNPVTPKQYSQILKIKSPQHKLSIPENTQCIIDEYENFKPSQTNQTQETTTGETADQENNPSNSWQLCQRGRPLRQRNVGQSQENNGKFKGASPKVWMFISRVTRDVNDEDIKTYLKTRTGDDEENIIVRELNPQSNGLKCYMVAADFRHKDEFYQPSFWPKGVGYQRFDFKLYEKYKKKHTPQNGTETQQNITQPASFLGIT